MKTWIVVLSVDGETSSQVVEAESSGFALRAALDALPASTDSRTVFVRVTLAHPMREEPRRVGRVVPV